MPVKLAYQYRLKPNKATESLLWRQLEIACRLYNEALAEKKRVWEEEKRSLSFYDLQRWWTAKRVEDKEFAQLNHTAGGLVLLRLERAFKRFFEAIKRGEKAGYPRFKKPHRFRTIPFKYGNGTKFLRTKNGKYWLYIQSVGKVQVVYHRPIPQGSVIKQVWVTRKADGWFVTFAVEVPEEAVKKPLPPTGKAVGIDVGVANLLTLSTGEKIDNPHWLKRMEEKLRIKQQILSRKQKGSKRWKRMCRQIAKLHLKIARQRLDFYYKLAKRLVSEFDLIAVEDLRVKDLAQGMLSKEIHDAGWGRFFEILSFKASSAGRTVIKVNPNGTTQICARCGKVVPKDLATRIHKCPHCGFVADRDVNAALNILRLGLERARGKALPVAVGQCPQEVAVVGLTKGLPQTVDGTPANCPENPEFSLGFNPTMVDGSPSAR